MKRPWVALGWILLSVLVGYPFGTAGPARAHQPPAGPAALLKDINPMPGASSLLSGLVALGDRAFFTANDGVHGVEVWTTDGTLAGTSLVKDVNPSGTGVVTGSLVLAGDGVLYFCGDDGQHGVELWRTDGTAAGTFLVKDLNPGAANGLITIAAFERTLMLVADDGVHGAELWRSDGTAVGTALVRDIHPGPDAGWQVQPSALTVANGWLYFSADDGTHGRELWRTDGRSATTLVRDINPGLGGSDPSALVFAEGHLYFAADDHSEMYSRAIWKTDGTDEGTVKAHLVAVGAAGDQQPRLINIGGMLYFSNSSPTRFMCELHGPALNRSFGTCPIPNLIVQIDGRVFFAAGGWQKTNELWVTDGTDAGTELFKAFPDLGMGHGIAAMTEASGWLMFSADDGQYGQELWQSDGTPAGTVMIHDINPGAAGSSPHAFTLIGNQLLFVAADEIHGMELWALPLGPRWAHRFWLPVLGR